MHYYSHHVGDYHRDTAHLSIVEHGVYRLLMDSYYSTERALPADLAILCRIVRAVSKLEREAVSSVAKLFFAESDGLLKHNRVERELEAYNAKIQQASDAGKASAARRNSVTKGQRNGNDRSTTVEFPLQRTDQRNANETSTIQEPVPINHSSLTESAPPPSVEKVLKAKKPKPEAPDPRREEFVSIFREFIESAGVQYDRPNAADNAQLKTMLKRKPGMTADDWRDYLVYINDNSRGQYAPTLLKDCGSIALVCSKIDRIQTYKDRESK